MTRKKQFLSEVTSGWQASSIQVSYSPVILPTKPICTEEDSIDMIRLYWNKEMINLQEQVMAFYLNTANKLIGYRLISTGTTSACLVDIKLVFALALLTMATFVIIAHNHPSGSLKPSKQDIILTEKLKNALKLIDIILLDHIIITQGEYLSMQRDGYC